MSLTSYRAAPPRDKILSFGRSALFLFLFILASFAVCGCSGASPPRNKLLSFGLAALFFIFVHPRQLCCFWLNESCSAPEHGFNHHFSISALFMRIGSPFGD